MFHLMALYRWGYYDRLYDQDSACGRSVLPCPGSGSHLLNGHISRLET